MLPPAAHSGPGKRKRNAARDALPLSHCGPQSVDEAWREHTHRVNCARQQAEAEGLVLKTVMYTGGAAPKMQSISLSTSRFGEGSGGEDGEHNEISHASCLQASLL